jgi:hypothetical protein
LVRRIFLYAFQIAERAGEEEKKWAYQRLLRRLLLGQPLNQPIPFTPKRMPARRVIQLDAAAIVPTPFQKKSKETVRAATIGPNRKTARRLALGLCGFCLLMTPLPYLVSRVTSAPTYRAGATPTQWKPGVVAARAESENHRMRTKAEKETSERFDQAQIKESLTKQLSGLRHAYARWSAKKQDTRGSVSLKLTVDGKGKVVAVDDFDSHLSEAGFIPVVMAEARKWRFPAGRAETSEVVIPLLFVPKTLGASRPLGWRRNSGSEPNGAIEKPDPLRMAKGVRSANLSLVGSEPPATRDANNYGSVEQPEEAKLDYMAQRMVALREEPRFASQAIEEIDGGTRIAVVEVVGDWFKVRTAHSHVAGFVRKEFIVPVGR